LKIAFSTASPSGEPVDPDCIAAVENAVQLCEDLGHQIEEAAPVYDWQEFMDAFGCIFSFMHITVEQLAQQTGRELEPNVERSILLTVERARSLSSEQIFSAFARLHALVRTVEAFFADWDVLLSPVALTPAPRLGTINSDSEELSSFEDWAHMIWTYFAPFPPVFNASGQPSVSIPLHHSAAGLPVGIQCTARVGDEVTLLRLASQLELARPWVGRKPPVSVWAAQAAPAAS
jgi:amidase